MTPGAIFLALFPFGGAPGAKVRPVVLLTEPIGPVPEVLAAYVSSVVPAVLLPTDVLLDPKTPDGASTNLKTTSLLRLHKLATIHQSNIVRRIGHLSAATQAEVETKLRLLLKL